MAKKISFVLAGILAVYIAFTFSRGLSFLADDSASVKILGISVIVIALIGIYVIVAEVIFGLRVSKLTQLFDDSNMPQPGSQLSDDDCEQLFSRAKKTVEEDPQNWNSWYMLSLAYELNRDRRRARESMRAALRLFR